MEILKHGNTYDTIQCEMCKAEIGFTHRDIEHKIVHDAYEGKVHETVTEFFYCPECDCRIVLLLKIDGVDREIRKNRKK